MSYLPTDITPTLERLRDALVPGAALVYIDVTPLPGNQPNHCHANVARHVRRAGGERVFGWKLWCYPGRQAVEAEFHCVWRDPSGRLVDITPDAEGETQILFVADPGRRYRAMAPEPNRVLVMTAEARAHWLQFNAVASQAGRLPVEFVG